MFGFYPNQRSFLLATTFPVVIRILEAVPTPAFFTQCQDVTRLNEVLEGSPKRSFRNLRADPAVENDI
ncbi:MAG: hypothetical protein RL189_737 [Pseudomonadota bacterium]|jgi:hypothetical protein